MNYTPDKWICLKITYKDSGEILYKILAGFYGNYLYGDSWRINSGIKKIVEHDNYYEVIGNSGSNYTCHKNARGLTSLTANMFASFKEIEAYIVEEVEIENAINALS